MTLDGKRIALLATDEFEDSELTKPLEALKDADATVVIISNKSGSISGKNGTEITVDTTIEDVSSDDYDGLLIPGGVGNPDVMRTEEKAVEFVRGFFASHKPVAAICHGPWLLVEADVLRDRTVTSWPSLKTDIKNAGGKWIDEEVVTDQGLVTSRNPDDIPVFIDKMIEEFSEGRHKEQTV
jgi:protease I